MAQQAATLPPEVIRQRWLEDKCFHAGFQSFDDLSKASGVSTNKITRSLKWPEDLWPDELMSIAEALDIHWFREMMQPMGFGAKRINYLTLVQMANPEGYTVDLVVNSAA